MLFLFDHEVDDRDDQKKKNQNRKHHDEQFVNELGKMLNGYGGIKDGIIQKISRVNHTTDPMAKNLRKSTKKVFKAFNPKTRLAPDMGLSLLSFGSMALGVNRKPVCNPSATKEATKQKANMGKTINPMAKYEWVIV